MSIGNTIKTLRRAKDITQEELAERLGITAKAVSQWECDRTTPDISQLPALCNYFEVTSDELLGINVLQKKAERDKLLDEISKLSKNGCIKEPLDLLHEGLKRFPNDALIMSLIITWSIVFMRTSGCKEQQKANITEECRQYSERILESSTDDDARHSAIQFLCDYYSGKNEIKKAEELASKMPTMCLSREFLLANIYRGMQQKDVDQLLKMNMLQFFTGGMNRNYKMDSGEYFYSADEIAMIRDKKLALFDLLFENGDYGFYNFHLSESHEMQARHYSTKNDVSKTIYHLSKATDAAIAFINYMRNETCTHTSLIFKGMDYSANKVSLTERDNIASKILSHMNGSEYDFIRDNAEFTGLKEKLVEYEGKNNY